MKKRIRFLIVFFAVSCLVLAIPLLRRFHERWLLLKAIRIDAVPFNVRSDFGGHVQPKQRAASGLTIGSMVRMSVFDEPAYVDLRSLEDGELLTFLSQLSASGSIQIVVTPAQRPLASHYLQNGTHGRGILVEEAADISSMPFKRIVTETPPLESEK
jgi:hypothetical protein